LKGADTLARCDSDDVAYAAPGGSMGYTFRNITADELLAENGLGMGLGPMQIAGLDFDDEDDDGDDVEEGDIYIERPTSLRDEDLASDSDSDGDNELIAQDEHLVFNSAPREGRHQM